MTDSIIVINLDRSPDRWAAFQRVNGHVAYERFSACDGAMVSPAELEASGVMRSDLAYTSGAVGNALSHVTLWRRALSEGRALTICEDDAVFNKNFGYWQQKALTGFTSPFDLILWGWNFDAVMTYDLLPGISHSSAVFDQAALRDALGPYQRLDFTPSFYRLRAALGLPCYTISPRGAEHLLKACLPLGPAQWSFPNCANPIANTAIDIAMSALYPTMQAFVSLPPLVVTPNVHETSTVQREPAPSRPLNI